MTEREPLTDEQAQAVTEACAAHPNGWKPHPENLPLAEGLVQRGVLERRRGAVYYPTSQFAQAAALHAATFGAGHAQN